MVREEGSVYRHSQQLPLSLQLPTQFSRAASPADGHTHLHHTRQQLPAPPSRRQRAFSSMTTPPLRSADARAAGKGITRRGRRRTTQARSTARLRSWRCRWAPFALCLQAAPSAHQSGHAHMHPDAICAAPRSPPPPLSCEPEGRTTIVACFLDSTRVPAPAELGRPFECSELENHVVIPQSFVLMETLKGVVARRLAHSHSGHAAWGPSYGMTEAW